jgi:F-type H+-transporting ATPase subunit b
MHLATGAVLAAAKEETNNPILPNATFIAEVVAFAILLFLLNRYALPPLKKAMTDRQDFIDRQIKDSVEAKERLEAAEAEYRELLDSTKADASRIREEARAEGRAIIDELRTKAQEEADRVRSRGEEQLAAEREQVVAALRADLGRLATELAERIIGESLDDSAAQSRVVDRFLTDLDSSEAAARESKGAR